MAATGSSQDLDKEGDNVARKIAGLLYSKCEKGYVSGRDGSVSRPIPQMEVSAEKSPLHDEDRFLGYQWKGSAVVYENGRGQGGTGYGIFKRDGKWFFNSRDMVRDEQPVEVSLLRSIAPACPAR